MTVSPILPEPVLDRLRDVLADEFDAEAVSERLGLAGESALGRGDLAAVERMTRDPDPTATLVRLFMLGLPVPEHEVASALGSLGPADAVAAGLLEPAGSGAVRSCFDLRPYGESDVDWWVVSDLGSDVRSGPLHPEHVLGVGTAATTLAQATVRRPVQSALDVGTGCGVQALHLSRHAEHVTVTDLSPRALAVAMANARLNHLDWEPVEGSLLEPVAGRRFDLVVSNPPFIVGPGFSPGADGYRYRDSGLGGDDVCRTLITGLPAHLNPGGQAQLLANWMIHGGPEWSERLQGWLSGSGCDAWVWQREVAEPGEYIALWLRDAGERPGTDRWRELYDRWADWFESSGVIAVGMGMVSMRRTDSTDPVVICEDVPQAYAPPIGAEVAEWFDRARWLAATDSDALFETVLRRADDLVLTTDSLVGDDGWAAARTQLRQSHGMRWDIEADEAVAGLVAALPSTGAGPSLSTIVALLAATYDQPFAAVADALEPVLRDLVRRGFLIPDAVGRA